MRRKRQCASERGRRSNHAREQKRSRAQRRYCFLFEVVRLVKCSRSGGGVRVGRGSVGAQLSFGVWVRTPCRSELSRLLNSLWAVRRPERNWSSPGQERPRRAGAEV